MNKTMPEYFRDWEAHTFGFGYGTGEPLIVPALAVFLSACPEKGAYDYAILEERLGGTVAWLLINALCRNDTLEYGVSPRYAWLQPHGVALKKYVESKTTDELVESTCATERDTTCYPDACNCGPNGYEKGRVCDNPFWPIDRRFMRR